LVREANERVELDGRLKTGKPEPGTAKESQAFAEVCFYKKRYVDAVGLYRRAFALGPKGAATRNRFKPACAAALAAAGRDEAAGPLHPLRRVELRKQALAWLRADLDDWGRYAKEPKARPSLAEARMRVWKRHPDLASLREEAAVAQLPDD